MLEILIAQRPGQCQVFFNISKNVGIKSPNDPLDVMLVQLGYSCFGTNPQSKASPAGRQICRAINVGAPYRGDPNDPLSKAIIEHQKTKNSAPDGHVSRMTGSPNYSSARGGSDYFLLAALCNNIYDMMSDVYPRIDRSPNCPPALANHIRMLLRN